MFGALGVASEIGFEETFSRALQTLFVIPDRERRFMCIGSAWPPYVREFMDAYSPDESAQARFRPTPRDVSIYLDVLSWGRGLDRLAWQILIWRSCGLSFRAIADQFDVSGEAIRLRYGHAIDQIRIAAYAAKTVTRVSAA